MTKKVVKAQGTEFVSARITAEVALKIDPTSFDGAVEVAKGLTLGDFFSEDAEINDGELTIIGVW